MGDRGPLPSEKPVRRNVDAVTVVLAPYDGPTPSPPVPLDTELQEEWAAVWSSGLAANLAPTDLGALNRLFRFKQMELAASRACNETPVVPGSQGQDVSNPRCGEAIRLAGEIRQLEDRYGLHPRGRLNNGVRLGMALDAAQRHPGAFGLTDDEVPPRADPRLPQS